MPPPLTAAPRRLDGRPRSARGRLSRGPRSLVSSTLPRVRLGLLGSLTVLGDDGCDLPIRGRQQRAVLALLGIYAPETVSAERLADELWGETASTDPMAALHARVYQLRRILGADVIRRDERGYALALPATELDVLEMRSLLATGSARLAATDPAGAIAPLREGLALWRGDPLADLADLDSVRTAVAGWREAYLAGHEDLAAAELALGRADDTVIRLTELVAANPLREHLRALLMHGLYRQGRQTDALRSFQEGRRLLIDELGLDPGPELVAMERAILAHDRQLAATVPMPASDDREPHPADAAPAVQPRDLPPLPLAELISRRALVDELDGHVTSSRLVTLVGPGGSGKTRLALEVAYRRQRATPAAAVCHVALAPLASDGVGAAVLDALGRSLRPECVPAGASVTAAIIAAIGDEPLLLVLDNCEHVIGAASALASQILAGCAAASVLATSREPLGIAGEQLWPMSLLTLPDSDDFASVSASEAAQLFVARARLMRPDFELDTASAPLVARICRRLDGLPLAIELAAARVRTMALGELAERLAATTDVLRSPHRDEDARHVTLEALAAWSYALFDDDEQVVFRHVACFAGSFRVEDVVAVVPGALDRVVMEFVLDGLVARSVLEAETGPDGTRYRMLATLQAFGLERLREVGEFDQAKRAHAHLVNRGVIAVDIASRTADQLGALAGLDAHYADITAALRWAADHDVVLALRIAGNVAYPWWMVERYGDAMEWLERLLPSVDHDPSIPPAVAARALAMSGYLGSMGGWGYDRSKVREHVDRAIARGRRAIELLEQARKTGPRADHAAAGFRQMLAISLVRRHIFLGRKTTADVDELLDEALSRHEAMGDLHGVGMCHAVGAIAALAVGDIDLAEARADDAARHLTPFGDRFGLERIAWMRGLISEGRGDLLGARAGYEAALAYATELRMREAVAAHERQLATVNDAISAPAAPGRNRARSDALRATDTLATAAALHLHLALRETDPEVAAAAGRRALSWYRDLGIVHGEVVALVSLAVIAVDARHLTVAAYLLDEAAAIGWLAEDPELDALTRAVSGYLAAAEPNGKERALRIFDEAADMVPSLTAILPAGLVERAYAVTSAVGWVRRQPASGRLRSRRQTADREPPPVRGDEPYIAVIGDRVVGLERHDAIEAAIAHATMGGGRSIAVRWAATNGIDHDDPAERLRCACALWIAPGTPYRSTEGALAAIKCAREHDLPLLATGGGFHHVVMEYARSVLGFVDTSQAAYDPFASRLFAGWPDDAPQSEFDVEVLAGSTAAGAYECAAAREHESGDVRIAPLHIAALEAAGLRVSGRDRAGDPQIVELETHPFYVATLFLPHTASSARHAHPLVRAFVDAARDRAYGELAR